MLQRFIYFSSVTPQYYHSLEANDGSVLKARKKKQVWLKFGNSTKCYFHTDILLNQKTYLNLVFVFVQQMISAASFSHAMLT